MDSDRRRFIKGLAYSSLAVPVALKMASSAFASDNKAPQGQTGDAKKDLRVLNDRPLVAEASPSLLDDEITPTERVFVRNNGIVPPIASSTDIRDWRLLIDGEVEKATSFSMQELKTQFKSYTYALVLECAGNGRAGFYPPAAGIQWTYGGVACPLWEGVRLKDLLTAVGVKKSAVYVAYYGYDIHPSGDPDKVVISRGVPIAKGLDEMNLVAWGMNGQNLPGIHGFPARLVCPGYPASVSGKWLKRIWIRDRVHDGPKMTGKAYKVPRFQVAPGTELADKDMQIIELMPVKSLITHPRSGLQFQWQPKQNFSCRGFAWSGHGAISDVSVSSDFGQTWHTAVVKAPRNRFAWQRWEASFPLAGQGYHEIWARATDVTGKMQPMLVPGWNPEGYLNNAMPRIAIHALA